MQKNLQVVLFVLVGVVALHLIGNGMTQQVAERRAESGFDHLLPEVIIASKNFPKEERKERFWTMEEEFLSLKERTQASIIGRPKRESYGYVFLAFSVLGLGITYLPSSRRNKTTLRSEADP